MLEKAGQIVLFSTSEAAVGLFGATCCVCILFVLCLATVGEAFYVKYVNCVVDKEGRQRQIVPIMRKYV